MNANDIRKGIVIMFEGDLCKVMEFRHHTPGNLRAMVQAKLRNLRTGNQFEHRFRSNIAVDGPRAWEEQTWVGRKIRIGEIEFEAVEAKARCLATHANPITGHRDVPIMKTLLKAFPTERPTFAIAMRTSGRGGTINVGDTVAVSD